MSALPNDPHSSPPPLRMGGDGPAHETQPPLGDRDFDQIRMVVQRAKPIEKAVRYAHFSGWTTLLAGVLSIPFAFGNTPMLIFTVVLAGIGTRELTLRRSLKSLDQAAPTKLAINQLMLGGVLMIYAVFMLLSAPAETMVESAMNADPMMQSAPELNGMMDDLIQLEQVATALIYVGMIVMAVFFQGGTALYYFFKGPKLRKLHNETPDWVIRVYQTVHG